MVQLGRSARKKKDARNRGSNSGNPSNNASSLISSAVSLDGQSLQLPEEYLQGNVAASAFLGIAPSLDGESLLLPDEDSTAGDDGGLASYMNMLSDPSGEDNGSLDFQDDVSSINDESIAHPDPVILNQNKKYLKIVGSGSGDITSKETDVEMPTNGGSHKDNNSLQTPTKISFPTSVKSAKDSQKAQESPDATPAGGFCCCCPVWIRKAPTWLKFVFAVSLVLLVAAMALVGVGLTMAIRNKQASQAASQNPVGPAPSPTSSGNGSGTIAPSSSSPVNTTKPTNNTRPGSNSTANNATSGGGNGIDVPVGSINNTNVTVFYATGGRYPDDVMSAVPGLLASLPASTDGFMAHLGDWNAPSVSGCVAQDYDDVATLFESSSLPVYFVVGDNEYNDCSDEEEALGLWQDSLVDYETEHWPKPSWEVLRQDVREENYAFYTQRIIFVGINLVAGSVISSDEWVARLDDDLSWIDENYAQFITQGAKALVLFGHASPDHDPNAAFFSQLFARVQSTYSDIHVVFIHRNTPQQTSEVARQYNNITNLDVIAVQGSVWPPMKIALDLSGDAVTVSGDQMLWYENLQAAGGNR